MLLCESQAPSAYGGCLGPTGLKQEDAEHDNGGRYGGRSDSWVCGTGEMCGEDFDLLVRLVEVLVVGYATVDFF